MTAMTHKPVVMFAAAIAATVGLFWNGDLALNGHTDLISTASARVGRPLTPVSYAGVARRTTRRAVARGAAVAPVRGCVQTVNSYGRVTTVCR